MVKFKNNFDLWFTGNIVGLFAGIGLTFQYGLFVGLSAGFAICVLVDIRAQLGGVNRGDNQ